MAAVIKAPLEAGDNIPNMAKTEMFNSYTSQIMIRLTIAMVVKEHLEIKH